MAPARTPSTPRSFRVPPDFRRPRLPETGNVLANFGGLTADKAGRPTDDVITGYGWVRIVEVTHDPEPEVLFELVIDERAKGKGWDVYRARRISLF